MTSSLRLDINIPADALKMPSQPLKTTSTSRTDAVVTTLTADEIDNANNDKHIATALRSFTAENTRIDTTYDAFTAVNAKSIRKHHQTYNADINKKLEQTSLLRSTQPANASATSMLIDIPILQAYDPVYDHNATVYAFKPTLPAPTIHPAADYRVLLEPKVLTLAATVEPLFCEVALFDTQQNIKLSETFTFCHSQPLISNVHTMQTLNTILQHSTLRRSVATKAIFSLTTHSSPHVHMILLVYKCLQGAMSTVLDAYTRVNSLNDKERSTMESKALESCQRWGQWKQLLAWSAVPVFDETRRPLNTFSFTELYRPVRVDEGVSVERLCEWTNTMINKKRHLKVIPGQLNVECKQLSSHRDKALEQVTGTIFTADMIYTHQHPNQTNGVNDDSNTGYVTVKVPPPQLSKPATTTLTVETSKRSASSGSVSTNQASTSVEMSPDASPATTADPQSSPSTADFSVGRARSESADVRTEVGSPSSLQEIELVVPPTVSVAPVERTLTVFQYAAPESEVTIEIGELRPALSMIDHALTAVNPLNSTKHSFKPSQTTRSAPVVPVSSASSTTLYQLTYGIDGAGPIHQQFTNTLLIYPQSVIINDARNVSVSIQVKDNDDNTTENGLPYIHARSDSMLPVGTLVDRINTAITYHCPKPSFVDEIKIELPLHITSRHHLLFTFINVSCKDRMITNTTNNNNNNSTTAVEQYNQDNKIVGYSILPLRSNNTTRLLDESYHLPLFKKLNSGYLKLINDWNDRKKAVFMLRTNLLSSIYTNDPYLHRFFTNCHEDARDDMMIDEQRTSLHIIHSGVLSRTASWLSGRSSAWDHRWCVLTNKILFFYRNSKENKVINHVIIDEKTRILPAPTKEKSSDKNGSKVSFDFLIKNESTVVGQLVPAPPPMLVQLSGDAAGGRGQHHRKRTSYANAIASDDIANGEIVSNAILRNSSERPLVDLRSFVDPSGTVQIVVSLLPSANGKVPHHSTIPSLELMSLLATSKLEAEVLVHCDDADTAKTWMKAITQAKIDNYNELQSIRAIKFAQPAVVMKWLPVIITRLMNVLCSHVASVETKTTVFAALLDVFNVVDGASTSSSSQALQTTIESERCPLLDSFVQNMFNEAQFNHPSLLEKQLGVERIPICDAIMTYWLALIRAPTSQRSTTQVLAAKFSWCLFDLIFKSIHLTKRHENNNEVLLNLLSSVVEILTEEVTQLCSTNQSSLAQRLNRYLALFIKNLFDIIEISQVDNLIAIYLLTTSKHERKTMAKLKFIFLSIICDHSHYIQLNQYRNFQDYAKNYFEQPNPIYKSYDRSRHATMTDDQLNALVTELQTDNNNNNNNNAPPVTPPITSGNFLPLVLIKQVDLAFLHPSRATVLKHAAHTLRSILTKHDYDHRYNTADMKSYIAVMYITLLPTLWKHLAIIAELPIDAAKKDLLACALYIIQHIPSQSLYNYFLNNNNNNIKLWYQSFISLLTTIAVTFEYSTIRSSNGEGAVLCANVYGDDSFDHDSLEHIQSKYSRAAQFTANSKHRRTQQTTLSYTRNNNKNNNNINTTIAKGPTSSGHNRTQSKMNGHNRNPSKINGHNRNRSNMNGFNNNNINNNNNSIARTPLIEGQVSEYERTFSATASTIILSVIRDVIVPLSHKTIQTDDEMQNDLLWFFHGFLSLHQSETVITQTFTILNYLLKEYSHLLWSTHSRFSDPERCTRWWFQLIRHCSFASEQTRNVTTDFIYQMFHSLYNTHGSCNRIRGPCIRAFARVFDYIRDRSTDDTESNISLQTVSTEVIDDSQHAVVIGYLRKACQSLCERAQSEVRDHHHHMHQPCLVEINDVFGRLQAVIDTSAKLHCPLSQSRSIESRIDDCLHLIQLYDDAPRLMVSYYKLMFDIYELESTKRYIVEAAHSQWKIADLIYTQLIGGKELRKSNSLLWSVSKYTDCIRCASQRFEQSEWYERAIECEQRLHQHYANHRDWVNQVPIQKRIVSLTEKLALTMTQGDTRTFSSFYRIGFYGEQFGNEHSKEYVYRCPPLTKLMEISQMMTAQYSTQCNTEVTIFKDSSFVDITQIDIKQHKLQLTAVHPTTIQPLSVVNDSSNNNNNTHTSINNLTSDTSSTVVVTAYDRSKDLTQFSFDTPFTINGKSHGTLTEQYKRRCTLTVAAAFPSTNLRSLVIDRSERVITPIECVIEDMRHRIQRMQTECAPLIGSPNMKTLSAVLTGSVTTQVNGGCNEVCSSFLSETARTQYPTEHVNTLRVVVGQFFAVCRRALLVAMDIGGHEESERAQQEAWSTGFETMLKQCGQAAGLNGDFAWNENDLSFDV